jgi:2-keto-3-deoxy-L-rhamnonate aldolase RhmA
MRQADAATLVVGMIETREGLANVNAIAAVDGIDILHVGCVDLLLALDKPDQQGCPEILEAIHKVGTAARRHGKILGIGGDRDADRRARYIREGARFMTTETDIGLLMNAAGAVVNQIRSLAAKEGRGL